MSNTPPRIVTPVAVLDFSHISREVRSLVTRRRELMVFLGSIFVALSIYLNNLLHGSLPPALAGMGQHAFFSYSLMLCIPTALIAMRIMRLHGGMTINGIFYNHILTRHGNPTANTWQASRLNWAGISTGLFLLTVINTALATVLFAISLHMGMLGAVIIGICCGIILLLLFLRNHIRASKFALAYIETVNIVSVNDGEIKDHYAQSLQDANQDLTGITAFVALILFSVMENLSGLGDITSYKGDIALTDIMQFGPMIYAILALITVTTGMLMYRRLAVAVGELSLKLDPTDDPFAPLRLTDTLLGYLMLCALFGIALHLLTFTITGDNSTVWWLELMLNLVMILLYPLRMWRARLRTQVS